MDQFKLSEEVRCLDLQVESKQEQINEVMDSSRVLEKLKQEYEEHLQDLESKKLKLEEEYKELNKELLNLKTNSKIQDQQLMTLQKLLKESEEKRIEAEKLYFRKESEALKKRCKLLEDNTCRLKNERDTALEDVRVAQAKQLEARSKYDSLKIQFNDLCKTLKPMESEGAELPDSVGDWSAYEKEDIIQSYVEQIGELESENRELRKLKEIVSEHSLERATVSERKKSTLGGIKDTSIFFDCSSFGQFPEVIDVDSELDAMQKEEVGAETDHLSQSVLDRELRRLDEAVKHRQKRRDEIAFNLKEIEELKQRYEGQVQTLVRKKPKLEKVCEESNTRLNAFKTQTLAMQRTLQREYQRQFDEKDEELKDIRKQLKEKEEELKYLMKQEKELIELEEFFKEAVLTRETLKNEVEQMKVKAQLIEQVTAQHAQLVKHFEEVEKKHNKEMEEKDRQMELREDQEKYLAVKFEEKEELLKRQEKEQMKFRELLKEADEALEKLMIDFEQMTHHKAQLKEQIEENEKKYAEKMDVKNKQVQWLEEQNQRHLKTIERKERILNMQAYTTRQKVQEGEEARSRLRQLNQAPETPPPAKNSGASRRTAKSTKVTPPASDDKSRKEWLEQQLDASNQRVILKTILDSEIEQRKHTARLQRETAERLKAIERCISKDESCEDQYSELVETLQKKQEEYIEKMEKHSAQIEEFQTRFAEVRSVEEKPDPITETKRWTRGTKSLSEAREILRVLFKMTGDLKVQSYQYYAEKARLELEFAEVEEKLETSECQIKDLMDQLERVKAALVRSASFAPKITTTDISNVHVVDLLKRMKHEANVHNKKDISDVSSDDEDTPAVDALNLDLDSDSEDSDDEDWKNSSNGGFSPDSQTYTPQEEAKVLHCLNLRLAQRGEPQAQALTIPLMTEELMVNNSEWERENKSRNALIWECMTSFMPETALTRRGHSQPDNTLSEDGTAISHNTSRQTKESQRRHEDTMKVEDSEDE